MPPNSSDITLRFLLDEAAQQRVDKGITTLAQELSKVGVSMEDIKRASFGDEVARDIDKVTAATKKVTEASKIKTREVEQGAKKERLALMAEARVMSKEVAAIIDDLAVQQISALNQISGAIQGVSTTALVAGGAIVGGIFAEVQRYVSNAEKATDATRAWKRETDSLSKSRTRIDEVLTKEALPALRLAARYANEAASFVEAHPEIVQTALKAGAILIGIGTIGTLIAKGIKLYADVKTLAMIPVQLTAAKLQDTAADKQLAAAMIRAKQVGAQIPGGGGGAGGGFLAAAVPVAGFLATNVAVSVGLASKLDQLDKVLVSRFGALAGTVSDILETALVPIFPVLRPIRDLKQHIPAMSEFVRKLLGLGDAAKDASSAVDEAIGQLAGSEHEAEVVAAFQSWREDDARMVTEAAESRRNIIEESEREISNITTKYNSQRVEINRRFTSSRSNIVSGFAEASEKQEREYANERADIIRDSGEEIRDIEADHQENLRKLIMDYTQRRTELVANRDALGLVKSEQQFDRERAAAENETNKEIAQRNRQTAIRLQQLAAEFAQERAQRQVEFAQALAENEQNRQEELRQAAETHAKELTQAREAREQQLRDLQEGLNAERIRRRETFLAEIRDLDESLLGERGMKQRNYDIMLADAQRYFDSWRGIQTRALSAAASSSVGAGTTGGYTPIHDYSGYAYTGIYKMAANGMRQFVLGGDATRAAERAIGGQLNERNFMRGLGRGSVTWNDHRRFDSRLKIEDRHMISQDTLAILGGVVRGRV